MALSRSGQHRDTFNVDILAATFGLSIADQIFALALPAVARTDVPQTDQGKRTHLAIASAKDGLSVRSDAVLSSSEIDANLLASLRAVAKKANLKVEDLLDEERRQHASQLGEGAVETISPVSPEEAVKQRGRSQREASEELEALAGDVSVDLMAFELAAGSPVSDVSVLRSPMAKGEAYADTPQVFLGR